MEERDRNFIEQPKRSKAFYIKLACVLFAVLLLVAYILLVSFLPLRRMLPAYCVQARGEGELRLHFISVGQGDCTVVEFPDGEIVVVDAGDGSFENENKLYRYIKALKPVSMSIIATHADTDHYGGFTQICKDFSIERAYLPALGSELSAYADFLESVERSGAQAETVTRRTFISHRSGAYIACVSPEAGGTGDKNEDSAVLFISYQGVNALLAGDIGEERENSLMREYALAPDAFDYGNYRVRLGETDILKVSHHGSAYSSSESWLELLCAKTAVVSAGRGNVYAHPAEQAMARLEKSGAQVYRTDELDDIMITVADGGYTVTHANGENI